VRLRKFIFWLHLLAGVFAGAVVFIMSVTGLALTYQKQLTEWADRSYWPAATGSDGAPLRVDELVARAAATQPGRKPSAVTFYADPAAPAVVTVPSGQIVFVDRYSGATTVGGSITIRSFFRVATEWHRYLGAGGESRASGRAITGACNLAFLFIVASGFYLWWPKSWTLRSLRSVTWFRRGLKAKARDFNWHNVFGFWSAIPLFLVVLSATVISYPWASSLVYQLAGTPPPARAPQVVAPADSAIDTGDAEALLRRVEQAVPGWRTISMRLPGAADPQVTFTADRSFGGRPQMRTTVVLFKQNAGIARIQTFADQSAGERARAWLRFVHTGEFYGVAGQTIAGIASGAGAMLVFTGISLAVRRLIGWSGRRNRRETYESAPGKPSVEYPMG
jgi:uncharacterized iron-regulated membrane protein